MVFQTIDDNGNPISNVLSPTTTEKKTLSGSSVQFAVNSTGRIQTYRLVADADIHYLIGENPTATTSTVYLPVDTGEQIAIFPGERLAAIGSGDVYLTSYRGSEA